MSLTKVVLTVISLAFTHSSVYICYHNESAFIKSTYMCLVVCYLLREPSICAVNMCKLSARNQSSLIVKICLLHFCNHTPGIISEVELWMHHVKAGSAALIHLSREALYAMIPMLSI